MVKRCFICGAKEDGKGNCTNPDCPRYVAPEKTDAATSTGTTGAAN